MKTKYLKCSKCGNPAKVVGDNWDHPVNCPEPNPMRISGMCGGSLTECSTKEEFEKAERNYRDKEDK